MFNKLFIFILASAFAFPAFALEKAADVTDAKGRVEIVHGDAVIGKRAEKGSELIFKDILRTKRRGYAEVGFIDGTNVKVFEKSRLTINGLERTADGYNAEIQKGKVLFNVEKMEDVAGDFRVKTTNSIIGVKGTTFGVVSGGLVTIVEVYNGNVEVLATVDRAAFESGEVDVGEIEGTGKGGDSEENQGTLVASLSSGQGMVLTSSGDVTVYEFSNDGDSKSLIFKGAVATGKSDDSDSGEGDSGEGGSGDGDDQSGDDGDDGDDQSGEGTAAADSGDESGGDDTGGTGDDAGLGGDTGSTDDDLFSSIGNEEASDAGDDGGFDDPGAGAGDGGGDFDNGLGSDLGLGDGLGGGSGIPGVGDIPGSAPDTGGGNDAGDTDQVVGDVNDAVGEADDFYSNPDARPDTAEQIDIATGIVNINITFK